MTTKPKNRSSRVDMERSRFQSNSAIILANQLARGFHTRAEASLAKYNRDSITGHFEQDTLAELLRMLGKPAQSGNALVHLMDCSHQTGGFVHFPVEYGCVPVLVGDDERPVLLYKIVEEMESLIDPDDIREQFPTLSYTKIVGALMFLRKMAQFNTRGLDLDDTEDALMEKSEVFQKMVADAMKSGESRRVHSSD